MKDFKTILFELKEGVAILTLNRPQALNAMSIALEEELLQAVQICQREDEVRAVLITGAGRAFCAGGDLKYMEGGLGLFAGKVWVEHANRLVEAIAGLPKPVIAAVNGPAVGGGMNLALVCDAVIAAEEAFFSEIFTQVGLVPDTGGHWILPRLVGLRKAMELIFNADKISAAQALGLGLINQVVPRAELMDRAWAWARRWAQGPTKTLGLSKSLLNKSWETNLSTMLALEALAQSIAFKSQDHQEGLAAFKDKRPPNFKGD